MSEGLNIVVCIKQVPETTEVNFDEDRSPRPLRSTSTRRQGDSSVRESPR
jgi:hypothetical protein